MNKKYHIVTSNFSFSHNVLHSYIIFNASLCSNGLKLKLVSKTLTLKQWKSPVSCRGIKLYKHKKCLTLSQTTNFRHFQTERVYRGQF